MLFGLFSRKGVSPLIATILLIAFAVALGSVVMNWGLNLDLGSKDGCSNVDVKIRSVDEGGVCFGGFGPNGYINFFMDNTGSADVNGLAIWIVGDKGTSLFELNNISINRGDIYHKKDKEISYDFLTYGNIKQVQFIPKINSGQALELCPRSAVKADKLSVCP